MCTCVQTYTHTQTHVLTWLDSCPPPCNCEGAPEVPRDGRCASESFADESSPRIHLRGMQGIWAS